jgi:hypothetical protein
VRQTDAGRHIGDDGEDLQSDMSGAQPRQVDMALIGCLAQIAGREQGVSVQIRHQQPLVQRLRRRSDPVGRRGRDSVPEALRCADQPVHSRPRSKTS